jgi:hypothetical protein
MKDTSSPAKDASSLLRMGENGGNLLSESMARWRASFPVSNPGIGG